MKRGVTGLLAALAATLVVVAAAGAAEPRGQGLTLRETVNSAFPQKQYILGSPVQRDAQPRRTSPFSRTVTRSTT